MIKKSICPPCADATIAMSKAEAQKALKGLKDWQSSKDAKSISREYVMKNFVSGMMLMNEVAATAEVYGHHPDLHLTGYRNLKVELFTHKVNWLTESDFYVASEINKLKAELKTAKG